jgi:hypothetical protein
MNTKRVALLVVAGGAVAVWLAAAATTSVRAPRPIMVPKPTATDLQGEALAAEITRLHERLRPSAAPVQNRDLFRYGNRPAAKPAAPSAAPVPLVPLVPLDAAPAPAFKLVGIAEDTGPDGPERTAIISDAGALLFVKEGDAVSRYRVTRISSDVVELSSSGDASVVRLALK